MKVGHLVSFGMGGADKTALNIISAMKKLGQEVQIFYTNASIPQATPWHHYKGYEPPSRQKQFESLGALIKITHASELNGFGLDVLHTHRSGEDLGLIPGFQEAEFKFKIVETNFHGALKTRANCRVFPSQALLNKVGGQGKIIPNAIAAPASKENFRNKLGLLGKFVFLHVHRPDLDVYCDLSLQAYSKIQTSKTAFLWVGPNPQTYKDAERLNCKAMIFMDPTLDEIELSKIYNTADLFCHSNRTGETFGCAPAEAMMHGLPLISHRGFMNEWPQAQVELLGDMGSLYIESRSVDVYAGLMQKFMENADFWNEVSYYLTARAKSTYDSEIVAKKYLDLYKEVLDGN